MKKTAAALFACTLLLAGCGGSGESDGGLGQDPSKPVTVDIAIKDGKVTPQGERVNVKVGQQVTLHVTSDADEEVHVHSEPEHEYEVAAGDDTTYSFTLRTPGQVAVEAHHLDATIVQLVVRP
jgi:plastocyanin